MSTKAALVHHLSVITKIPTYVLEDRDRLLQTSIAQRMSWAARRSTSRVEDQAYALLGLFDIRIPLVYGGEGSEPTLRKTRLVRFMHDKMHRLFQAKSAVRSSDGSTLEHPTNKELSCSSEPLRPEMEDPGTKYELYTRQKLPHELDVCAIASRHELEGGCIPELGSGEVYELDSPPDGLLAPTEPINNTPIGSIDLPEIILTGCSEVDLSDISSMMRRRFSWEYPLDDLPARRVLVSPADSGANGAIDVDTDLEISGRLDSPWLSPGPWSMPDFVSAT